MNIRNTSTICVHGTQNKSSKTGAITVPIYASSTFEHPNFGESSGYDYSRVQNPTREYLEQTVANLENGLEAFAFSTGMAAETALFELFNPGDKIIVSEDLYGGTARLFEKICTKNGLVINYVDTSDLENVNKLISENTKAIFIETPTNPMMRVTDIKAISKIAKKLNLLLIIDNTFLTPYFQKPLDLGADIIIHSGTKYLCGHNDVLAGFLVCKDKVIAEQLRLIYKTTGACLSPFDSYLLIRGIKTLAIRMQKHEQNAKVIAEYLCNHKRIKRVYYAGLKNHPQYNLSVKQSSGFGGMISFECDSKLTALNFLQRVKLIIFAESLGGVESLVTYPMTQTHSEIAPEIREKNGINERLLRLSVGIEDVNDLLSDLEFALI